MARTTHRLNPLAVRQQTKPGLHADGNGLYLSVSKTGAKSWLYIYTSKKKRVELGLGSGWHQARHGQRGTRLEGRTTVD